MRDHESFGTKLPLTIQIEAIETDLRNGLGAKLRILDLRQAQFLVAKLGNWMYWIVLVLLQ